MKKQTLQLSLDGAPIAKPVPCPEKIKLLKKKGYTDFDVSRLTQLYALQEQFMPPDMQQKSHALFIKRFIVPSVSSALLNEYRRQRPRPKLT